MKPKELTRGISSGKNGSKVDRSHPNSCRRDLVFQWFSFVLFFWVECRVDSWLHPETLGGHEEVDQRVCQGPRDLCQKRPVGAREVGRIKRSGQWSDKAIP